MRAIGGLLTMALAAVALAGCDRHGADTSQAASASTPAPDEAPAAPPPDLRSAGKVDHTHKGEAAPTAVFTAPDGKRVALASFHGMPVLLNLWATWCGPCVAEMPTLDRMAAGAGKTLVVLPVSQDMDGPAKVAPYWQRARLTTLRPYLDPAMTLSLGLHVNLPTSILYDAQGREVWRLTGGMDWTSAQAKALLAEAR